MEINEPKNRTSKYHRILEAAVKVFARQGFRQSTVAQIAKEAGVADKDARTQAAEVLAHANKRSTEMVEEAKEQARAEGQRLVHAARAQIQQEIGQAKEQLRREVATLAVAGAKQILEREIDAKAHADLLDKVAKQLN